MSTRERLENIIIGTLLDVCGYKYVNECMSCLTDEMFKDATNRRIWKYIKVMVAQGELQTTPYDIFVEFGADVLDIASDMADKSIEYSFDILKTKHNETIWLNNEIYGLNMSYSRNTFQDYLGIFMNLVFEDEERERNKSIA